MRITGLHQSTGAMHSNGLCQVCLVRWSSCIPARAVQVWARAPRCKALRLQERGITCCEALMRGCQAGVAYMLHASRARHTRDARVHTRIGLMEINIAWGSMLCHVRAQGVIQALSVKRKLSCYHFITKRKQGRKDARTHQECMGHSRQGKQRT
jgi:hypothetical protein